MAMVARAVLPPDGPGCYVLGSDIVQEALARAREGSYPAASLEEVPPAYRRFATLVGARAWVRQELREATEFTRHNLVTDPYPRPAGGVWDVVFCRNVLIYFDDVSRRRVIDMFYDRLLPGGFLLLGHSESLLNVSTAFELVHLKEDLVYRKPRGRTVNGGGVFGAW